MFTPPTITTFWPTVPTFQTVSKKKKDVIYLQPFVCSNCGREGYAHDFQNFAWDWGGDKSKLEVLCHCSNSWVIEGITPIIDFLAMSKDATHNLYAFANQMDQGKFTMEIGRPYVLPFTRPFDDISRIDIEPLSEGFFAVPQHDNEKVVITLISDGSSADDASNKEGEVFVRATGLAGAEQMSIWRLLLYNAVVHRLERRYRLAIIEYAVAFEGFVSKHLKQRLVHKYNEVLADFILDGSGSLKLGVDDRVDRLLKFVAGKSFRDSGGLHGEWQTHVEALRNSLVHAKIPVDEQGKPRPLNEETAFRAHRAVWQSIRWMIDLQ